MCYRFPYKKTREIHSYEMRQAEKMFVQIFEDCSSENNAS